MSRLTSVLTNLGASGHHPASARWATLRPASAGKATAARHHRIEHGQRRVISPPRSGETLTYQKLSNLTDDLYQVLLAVALAPCQVDELFCLDQHRAALACGGSHAYASPLTELK